MKRVYLLLFILGTVLPLWPLLRALQLHGLSVKHLWQQINASHLAQMAWLDVLLAAITLWVFIGAESRRVNMRRVLWPVLATACVGVSSGLPLFLWMRQGAMESSANARLTAH